MQINPLLLKLSLPISKKIKILKIRIKIKIWIDRIQLIRSISKIKIKIWIDRIQLICWRPTSNWPVTS